MILCPICSHDMSLVKDTRKHVKDNTIRRRRLCEGCGHSFATKELFEPRYRELVADSKAYKKLLSVFSERDGKKL